MATITGWARRLIAADPVVATLAETSVLYEEGRSAPRCLTLRFSEGYTADGVTRFLEINLVPEEVRRAGDACADFLDKLQS